MKPKETGYYPWEMATNFKELAHLKEQVIIMETDYPWNSHR